MVRKCRLSESLHQEGLVQQVHLEEEGRGRLFALCEMVTVCLAFTCCVPVGGPQSS